MMTADFNDGCEPTPAELRMRLTSPEVFSDALFERLCSVASRESFASKQVIFEEAAYGTDFLLIAGGELEARRRTPFGNQKVAELGMGDLCGEISFLDSKPRSSGVVAVSEGRLWRFEAERVNDLAAEDPGLDVAILRMFCRTLAGKIRQANTVMSEIMAPGATASPTGSGAKAERACLDEDTKRRILTEQGLSSDEMQALTTYLETQRFASGKHIFVEGEVGDTLYIVADGRVRISRRIPGLGEEALAILEPGEVFGEMAWIDQSPRSADAIAHTGGCIVLAISRADLDGTIASSPQSTAEFLRVLCQVLCRRIRNMNDQLVAYRTIAWY